MEVTVQQLIDASEKNGFRWAKSDEKFHHVGDILYQSDPAAIVFSCVIGQGLANLFKNSIRNGHYPAFPAQYYSDDEGTWTPMEQAFRDVYDYNDNKATSFEDALRYMKERLAPFAKEVIDIERI